jgi:hypothetical protein
MKKTSNLYMFSVFPKKKKKKKRMFTAIRKIDENMENN